MAYTITCDGFTLEDPRDEELYVRNPKCNLEVNKAGEASFIIDASHPHYDKLLKKRSIFEIRQDNDPVPIFRGRMTEDTNDFYNSKQVDLEGVLTFFNDSMIRPFVFPDDFLDNSEYVKAAESGNVVEFFLRWLVNRHNEQMKENKFQRFRIGNVTVSDPNNYITRSSTDYLNSWEVLKTKLFESDLGGYLCIRYEYEDGEMLNIIDYLADFETENSQTIAYGENLLDLSSTADATSTYSAIIPLGKRKNEIDTNSTDETRLTIADLPDGDITDDLVKEGDTIYSKSANAEYGWIYAPVSETTWEDVSEAENLQNRGVDFLTNKGMKLSNTITIKAVDLHLSDSNIESFRIYKYVLFSSKPHNREDRYKLTRLELDLHNPQDTVIQVGESVLSMTDINAASRQQATNAVEDAKAAVKVTFQQQEKEVLSKTEELYNSKIEQLSKSITLELSGSLGNKAEIKMTMNGNEYKDEIDLAKVREAFANDKTAVTISAGVITFNSGTIVINSNNFSLDSAGHITANGATINGKVTTVSSSFMTELDKGSLRLYYDNVLCGTINTKYWSGASTEGISLRVEDGGNYIMFSHADDTQGSGYTVDYYLNAGWSSNYDEMHIFQTSARFLDDAYFAGKTRIRSLRLFDADGEYLVGINDGKLSVSKL